MTISKKNWGKQHVNDLYVKKAHALGYRSRAVFKLKEILKRYPLIKNGDLVVELGSVPGAWTQLLAEKKIQIVACDLLPMDAVKGVHFVQGDFLVEETQQEIQRHLSGRCHVILSDMSPDLTGSDITDQANMAELLESVLHFCKENLSSDGKLAMKLFNGCDFQEMHREIKQLFGKTKIIKPEASRQASKEVYLIADKFRL
ncbi:RlmE family RNA methyltransferase [Gammaproteobacteria bacterium]|nr:RlmE family RNA methyltransferase [Gammaproteobacteria bacterium]